MKKLKLFGLAALMAVGLASCGTNDNPDEKIAKSAVDVISVQNQISVYEVQLPALIKVNNDKGEKVSVNVTWEGTPAERWDFSKYETNFCIANVTLPDANKNESEVAFTLKATAKYNDAVATREFNGYLMPSTVTSGDETMTVEEVIAAEDGELVTVRGITASARNGNKGFFVVDETGAIYVYDKSGTAMNSFEYGNEVQITATRGANSGTFSKNSVQLVFDGDSLITVKSSEVKPVPTAGAKALTCAEFAGWKKDGTEDYSGGYYKVTAKLAKYTPGSYTTYELMDDNGKYIQLYASDGSVYNTEFGAYFTEDNIVVDGTTTKTKANYNVYIAVYDAKIEDGKIKSWRVAPLLVEAA